MSNENDLSYRLKRVVKNLIFEDQEDEKKIDHNKEKQVLKLAQAKEGVLTVTEVVLGTSLTLEEAEAILTSFSAKGYADMRVSDSGAIVYVFPAIRPAPKYVKTSSALSARQSSPPAPSRRNPKKSPVRQVKDATEQPVSKPGDHGQPEEQKTAFKPPGQKTSQKPEWMKKRTSQPSSPETPSSSPETPSSECSSDPVRSSEQKTSQVPDWMKNRKRNK